LEWDASRKQYHVSLARNLAQHELPPTKSRDSCALDEPLKGRPIHIVDNDRPGCMVPTEAERAEKGVSCFLGAACAA
jgi:hypothetical protein